MPETIGEMPVFGPIRPSMFALRGIRLLEGEDGAGSGDDDAEGTDDEADKTDDNSTNVEEDGEEDKQDDPAEKLKKALRAERDARKTAERERNTLRQQLEAKDKPAEEAALEAVRREAEMAANAKANERVAKAELRAAAAGKVSNLTALVRLVDVSKIEVDDDGTPSADDIEDAIAAFLTDYPEFAVDKSKFTGSADQGSKGRQTKPGQLTREQLKSMTPEQILKAQEEGLLNNVLGGKP